MIERILLYYIIIHLDVRGETFNLSDKNKLFIFSIDYGTTERVTINFYGICSDRDGCLKNNSFVF